ncbi:MAG: NADH-quinone oxidoreductase subunit L [Gemmatimonadota bacterium]|nr:NADH-quinone oxidoreductase subunit L [Gemmatimonadota bacterium]
MTVWLLPLLPLAGALVVLALGRAMRSSVALTLAALTTLLATLSVGMWAAVHAPSAAWLLWGPRLAPRLDVQGLARTMVVLVPLIAVPVVLFAGASGRRDAGLPRLLALLTAFTGLMELLVTAGDFLTLLIAWELVGACSWALIGYQWRDVNRVRAGRDAFLTTRVGDLGLYLAAAAAFAASGSLDFTALGAVRGPALAVVAAGVLLAAAAKSAQLPFSPWLFSAMAGPTPASALLHSATMVAAGAYLLARLAPTLSPAVVWFGPTVALLGLATALAGGLVASVQSDFKKALAGSTSAQYGLMFVAIGAGFPGAAGAHLVTHAAFKALLFLGAGVALHAADTLDLATLARARLGRTITRVALLVGVGTLALAAVPPLGGAYSKEQIVAAAAHASRWSAVLVVGALAAGLLSAFYAARLQLLAFAPGQGDVDTTDATILTGATPSTPELASLALLAALSVALGALWLPGVGPAAGLALGGSLAPGAAWELAASIATVIAGVGAAWLLRRRRMLVTLGLPDAVRAHLAAWLGLPALARQLIVRPTLALANALADFDGRVVDAGVRGAVQVATFTSGVLAWWGERGVDGIVTAVTRTTTRLADASRAVDDQGVDRIVEGLARDVGVVGTASRRLQTGLAHDYYRLAAAGTVVLIVIAALVAVVGRQNQ